jgi:hypothetical protein
LARSAGLKVPSAPKGSKGSKASKDRKVRKARKVQTVFKDRLGRQDRLALMG